MPPGVATGSHPSSTAGQLAASVPTLRSGLPEGAGSAGTRGELIWRGSKSTVPRMTTHAPEARTTRRRRRSPGSGRPDRDGCANWSFPAGESLVASFPLSGRRASGAAATSRRASHLASCRRSRRGRARRRGPATPCRIRVTRVGVADGTRSRSIRARAWTSSAQSRSFADRSTLRSPRPRLQRTGRPPSSSSTCSASMAPWLNPRA